MDWWLGSFSGGHPMHMSKSQIKKMKKQMQEATNKRENEIKIKEDKKKLQEEIQAENLLTQFDEKQ